MRALAIAFVIVAGCSTHVDQQRLPIGSACSTSGQCGTGKFFCDLSHANGYCKAECGKDADCPTGAVCVGAGMILAGACARACPNGAADCRAGDDCTSASDQASAFCAPPPIVDLGASD
jgi:hypothetical protein